MIKAIFISVPALIGLLLRFPEHQGIIGVLLGGVLGFGLQELSSSLKQRNAYIAHAQNVLLIISQQYNHLYNLKTAIDNGNIKKRTENTWMLERNDVLKLNITGDETMQRIIYELAFLETKYKETIYSYDDLVSDHNLEHIAGIKSRIKTIFDLKIDLKLWEYLIKQYPEGKFAKPKLPKNKLT